MIRRQRLRPLTEAEAYARCHGTRESEVRIVKLEPRRPRYDLDVSGGFTQVSQVTPSFVVGGHSAVQASLTVTVRDCREAIQRSHTAGLSYRVGSAGPRQINPTFMDGALSEALGTLFYKVCAHS